MAGETKPKIKLPDDYSNEELFLSDMRYEFEMDSGADLLNRQAGYEDMAFTVGKQWMDEDVSRRQRANKPILTINRLPAFIAQVLGLRLLNETTVKFVADQGGTKEVAQIREGVLRSILKTSPAEQAFDNALAGSVIAGIGNFEVEVDYESDDVFNQAIKFKPIVDHFSVVWDRNLQEPTGADAERAFQHESMAKKQFEKLYPWAQPSDLMTSTTGAAFANIGGWYENDNVRVVNYWRMRKARRTLAMMQSGEVQDITDVDGPAALAEISQGADGAPMIRQTWRKYAQMYVCTGRDILAGPYDLPIKRVPIFRVPGWELKLQDQRFRWGIVRFLKDPQRLHNYWRSVIAEKLLQTPRATWLASDQSVAGREKEFRNSHRSDSNLLIWNQDSGQRPELMPPAQLEQALIAQSEMSNQDIKDVSNIHEANLGMPSNEVSGVAITRRQQVSNTGNAIYTKNLENAIEAAGAVCNDLMPVVYDTVRIVKILGPDGRSSLAEINKVSGDDGIDITSGKYAVTATTGPSYDTKREESAANMMDLAQAMPQTLAVSADLIVEAQDWPGADKIAARIRNTMPVSVFSEDEMTPELKKRAVAQHQQEQVQAAAAAHQAALEVAKVQSDVELNAARSENYQSEAEARGTKTANDTADTNSQVASRELHDTLDTMETKAKVKQEKASG